MEKNWTKSDTIKSGPNRDIEDFFQLYGTAVCYDKINDIFIACGDGSDNVWQNPILINNNRTIGYSKDGKTWTSGQNENSEKGINIFDNVGTCVISNNINIIVAGGQSAANTNLAYSKDGKTWKIANCNYFTNYSGISGLCTDGYGFVAVGGTNRSGIILFSINGIDWNKAEIPDGIGGVKSVCYNGTDTFVAICDALNYSTAILYSKDGKKWIGIPQTFTNFQSPGSVCWDGKKFIAIGTTGNYTLLSYSKDGINWRINNFTTETNTVDSGFFNLGEFIASGIYWSGYKLFIYGSGNSTKGISPIIMIDDISPDKITYSKDTINIASPGIYGMCSKYVPSLERILYIPYVNNLEAYTTISDVTRNFVLNITTNEIKDGTQMIDEKFQRIPLNSLLKPQDKLYDTNNNWIPKWDRYYESRFPRNPGIDGQYPTIIDEKITSDRNEFIKSRLGDITPPPYLKVPVYVLKYTFKTLLIVNNMVLKNTLFGIPGYENSRYYPSRIYIYHYNGANISNIYSNTNLAQTTSEQIIPINELVLNVENSLYVILYDDYDCLGSTIESNYTSGLSIRNAYFTGRLPTPGYIQFTSGGGGGGGTKKQPTKTECLYTNFDPVYSDDKCLNKL